MSTAETTILPPPPEAAAPDVAAMPDRRGDIDGKQARVASLLREKECDGLLVMEPENFAWLSSGATARGILDEQATPALYFSAEQRWAIASNVDSQRLFDEELDGLGFQLKEWPWQWGRPQLLADLMAGRRVACDRPVADTVFVANELTLLRRTLTLYEQACMRALGQVISHAIEATCRTMAPGVSEREAAGQLAHRLLHRGAHPVNLGVAADGRAQVYRHWGFAEVPIRRHAVLVATARKYGLCASASRSVTFGAQDDTFAQQHDAACKVHATYMASTWPDAAPREILNLGRRVYQVTGYEHEWLQVPQGHVTGRLPVELTFVPKTEELFQPGWAVTWRASVGGACCCDTFLVTENGPDLVTPTEAWPLKRIRVQGADFMRPHLLERNPDSASREAGSSTAEAARG